VRTRWFGEPWPDAELRAPVCEDNADRIPTPTYVHCLRCEQPIGPDDQGIVLNYGGGVPLDGFTFKVSGHTVVAEHLTCFLLSVVGHDIAARCDP
jgi:hypothetical protein